MEGGEGRWVETIRDVQPMQLIVSSTPGTVPETGVHECCFVWKGFLEQKGANVPSFSSVEEYTQYLERTEWDTHKKASRQSRDLSWA